MAIHMIDKDKLAVAAGQKTAEREFWLRTLSALPPRCSFPRDRSGAEPGGLMSRFFTLDGELFQRVMKISGGSGVRLFMTLSAALTLLAGRYSDLDDVIIGAPVFTPDGPARGDLINTVIPLRGVIRPGDTFRTFLPEWRETIKAAAENQSFPMVMLLEPLGLEAVGDEFPLFDIMVALDNMQARERLRETAPGVAFVFTRCESEITGCIEYDAERYSETFILQIAGHYERLLEILVFQPDLPLERADFLSDQERHRLLVEFSGPAAEYPREKSIVELFQLQVEKNPGLTAVVCGDRRYTYRRLNEHANRLARFLMKHGVSAGHPAAVLLERSLELTAVILGILKTGAPYIPIDPEYPESRIRSILEHSGAAMLITDTHIIHKLSFTRLADLPQGDDVGEPVLTEARSPIADLDKLPLPDRTLADYDKYHRYIGIAPVRRTVTLQTSRGCPYNCIYCHKIWPKKHIVRSADHICREIRQCRDAGVRDFVFIDDIFNLDRKNSSRLLENIIREKLDIRLYFPNGLRADILDKEFIDLMAAAGAVNICAALESASPRLQKLIRKNLDIPRFRDNMGYIATTYPHIILEMEMMHGFPTETQEEALMTFEFLKGIRWIHFPNLNILKVFPNTEIHRLALEHGVSPQAIGASVNFAYHELPETLPVPKSFTRQLQARMMDEYFLLKERMLAVLPHQMKVMTERELIKKYDSYLPMEIRSFRDILDAAGIEPTELGDAILIREEELPPLNFNAAIRQFFPVHRADPDALRVLFLDLSQFFSHETGNMLYDVTEEPLGLMCLLSYLNRELGARIRGRIVKSRIDFNHYAELRTILEEFHPDLIAVRTLSYFRDFFHRTMSAIRQWGITTPIIAGGPYATSDAAVILGDPAVSLAVLGEGEETMLELARAMLDNNRRFPDEAVIRRIKGVAYYPAERKTRSGAPGRQVLLLDLLDREMERESPANLDKLPDARDLLYVISTSGTTGKPKGVMMEHRNLANLLHFQQHRTGIAFARVLQFASVAFDVSFQEIFSTLLAGGEIHLVDPETRSNVGVLLDYIGLNQIETLFFPPAFLRMIFDEPELAKRFPRSVRHIITAGEQLVVTPTMREYLAREKVYLHNHYGPAETHVVTTLTMKPGDEIPYLPSIGRPIQNTYLRILDRLRRLQPPGVPGEIWIGGDNVARGYRNQEQLTEERFVDGLYRTGDLGKWLPDGSVQFLGRVDRQVQVRGFRIEPEEIQMRLEELEWIKEAVVIDYRHENGDVFLCAYVVIADGAAYQTGDYGPDRLRDWLRTCLPDYMVPSFYIRLNELPLNKSGKLDRRALPAPETVMDTFAFAAPRDAEEKQLADIWCAVLEKDPAQVSINQDFFEAGGHSLKGTILIARIHQKTGVRLMLSDLFRYPTLRRLSDYIRGKKNSNAAASAAAFTPIPIAPAQDHYPLSDAQKRLYTLQRINPSSTVYNIPFFAILEGDVSRERAEQVFLLLAWRHEALRTAFVLAEGKMVQRILPIESIRPPFSYLEADNPVLEESARVEQAGRDFIRPFDLAEAPLFRVLLARLGSGRFLLLADFHHIISDGVTTDILIRDFAALYAGQELPPLRLQYKDFVLWREEQTRNGALSAQEEYWLRRFSGGKAPALDLPLDFPRAAAPNPDSEGDAVSLALDPELCGAVKKITAETHSTLFQFMLAVFFVLLHKVSGAGDIVVGSPVSGRRHADLAEIAGVFVNMVCLRASPEPRRSFLDFLTEARETVLSALENQDYPFDRLVTALGLQGASGGNPLFNAGFLLTSLDLRPLKGGPFTITAFPAPHRVARFDLLFGVSEAEETITIGAEYSTRLFKPSSMEAMLAHYTELLRQACQNPGAPIGEMTLSLSLKTAAKQKTDIQFNF